MDIVCKIVNSVKEIINDRSKVSADAVFVAYDFMNVNLSSEEIDEIIKFAERLEIRESPNFRSLYNETVNDAIWSIVCWATQCYRMISKIDDLLRFYVGSKFGFSLSFTEDFKWELESVSCEEGVLKICELSNVRGKDLLFEILGVIKN